jgi:hypothetical protein
MPITRADIEQTNFARKMRVYLAAHATKQHERQGDDDNRQVDLHPCGDAHAGDFPLLNPRKTSPIRGTNADATLV